MKRQFSACQAHRSMYPSIFNSFPVIRTAIAKNRRFHVPQPTFLFPLETRPCDYHAICCMDGKTIQCLPKTSQHVPCGSGIMTVNSPSGSTLQCGRWLWSDMPLNSPKRPPYWTSTSGFDFDHITAVDMSFCTSLQNFI